METGRHHSSQTSSLNRIGRLDDYFRTPYLQGYRTNPRFQQKRGKRQIRLHAMHPRPGPIGYQPREAPYPRVEARKSPPETKETYEGLHRRRKPCLTPPNRPQRPLDRPQPFPLDTNLGPRKSFEH
jgi:hypothetical protein